MRWTKASCLLALVSPTTSKMCNCGYAITDHHAQNGERIVFTELLVTDFTMLDNIGQERNWIRQQFDVSADAGRGKFGKSFSVENVFIYPEANAAMRQDMEQMAGNQRAMALRVGSRPTALGAITAAEIDTGRMDMFWGSYRVIMKLSSASGTCAAFFWYRNDTQEIDMEFLSREFDPVSKVFPVNLVIHSRASMEAGYDAIKSNTLRKVDLSFDPTKSFYEYRFDYLPGRVLFYANGQYLAEIKGDSVPSSGGHLILQHWSNGNPLWSGGPPSSDAVAWVKSVKAYFNSSDAQNGENLKVVCGDGERRQGLCPIPDVVSEDDSPNDDAFQGDGNASNDSSAREDNNSQGSVLKTARLMYLVATCALLLPAAALQMI